MAIGAPPVPSKVLVVKSPSTPRPAVRSAWSEERGASAWLLAVLFGLLTLVALAVPWLWPGNFTSLYVGAAIFPFVALFATRAVMRAIRVPRTFTVNDSGITARFSGGPPVEIRWKDVGDVRVETARGRLLVCGGSGDRRIPIGLRLDDFGGLATEIARRAFGPDGASALSSQSQRAVGKGLQRGASRWLLLVTAPVWPILSVQWLGGALLIAWVASAAQLTAWASGWISLRVVDGALMLRYPFRSRAVRIDEKSPVALTLLDELRTRRSDVRVVITLENGKTMQLDGLGRRAFLLVGELERLRSRPASRTTPAPASRTALAGQIASLFEQRS